MTVPGSQLSLTQQEAGFTHTGSSWIRNTWQGRGAGRRVYATPKKSTTTANQMPGAVRSTLSPRLANTPIHTAIQCTAEMQTRRDSGERGPADQQEEQKELCWMLIKESKALVVLSSSVRKPCLSVNKNHCKPCLLFVFSCKRTRSWHPIKCLKSI